MGTGGSTGSSYLKHTLDKKFFPELWEARTLLEGLIALVAVPLQLPQFS